MKKTTGVKHAVSILAVLAMLFGAAVVMASSKEKDAVHPELSEQEQLIACADCHKSYSGS